MVILTSGTSLLRPSPGYFVTDVKSQKVEFEKPYILLSGKKISLLQDILPSLEIAAQARRPLVIIAEDINGEALAACILHKLRGQLQVAASSSTTSSPTSLDAKPIPTINFDQELGVAIR